MKSIQVNEKAIRIDLSAPRVQIDVEVTLREGENTIILTAEDLIGNLSKVQRRVHVDRLGPVISLNTAERKVEKKRSKEVITGFVYDKNDVARLVVNGQQIPIPVAKTVELAYPIILAPEQEEIVVKASDAFGNETVARLRLANKRAVGLPLLLATTDTVVLAGSAPTTPGISEEVTLPRDMERPKIEVEGWKQHQSVYLQEAYLAGYVEDSGGVAALEVNEEMILNQESIKGNSQNVFFNLLKTLTVGANPIHFKAWDTSGNEAERRVLIERRIQEIRDVGARMDMVLFPFLQEADNSRFSTVVQKRLLRELVRTKRFDMTSALGLDAEQLENSDEVARMGREMKASYVLTGTIFETENGIEIFADVVETTSSNIIASEDVYGEQLNRSGLQKLCRGLAIKLEDVFPLVAGKVSGVDGQRVHLKFDCGHDIVKGMRCILFEEQEVLDAQTERVVDRRDIRLGAALIKAVKKRTFDNPSHCEAQVEAEVYETGESPIKRGHLVITQ